MAWHTGPLPPDTWGWGGVVPKGEAYGFYFADFRGNHVMTDAGKRVEAADVAWYDNSLPLTPVVGVKGRTGAT